MPLEGRRILLVEDEYFIVQDMARAFAAAGAEVVGPAATVADALATRGVPFVFATGYDQECIPERFSHCIRCEKPVKPDQVARACSDESPVRLRLARPHPTPPVAG